MSRLRIGIVGSGAVSELLHLPAITKSAADAVEVVAVCDPALDRAAKLAEKFGIPDVVANHRDLAGKVEAALVAVPNHLHAPVSCELLERGVHVLAEKIMALNTSDALAMVEASARGNSALTVGLEFRFFTAMRTVRQIAALGVLGDIQSFDIRLGVLLNWPVKSDYLMKRAQAGGGVLTDFGPHILDLLLWWLGDWSELQYADDACGGIEANCTINLKTASGAAGTVELSRNRTLRNTVVLTGSNGRVEADLWNPEASVRLHLNGEPVELEGKSHWTTASPGTVETFHTACARQWKDFAAAIHEGRSPYVTGIDGVRHVRLIEACYARRTPLQYEWDIQHQQKASPAPAFS